MYTSNLNKFYGFRNICTENSNKISVEDRLNKQIQMLYFSKDKFGWKAIRFTPLQTRHHAPSAMDSAIVLTDLAIKCKRMKNSLFRWHRRFTTKVQFAGLLLLFDHSLDMSFFAMVSSLGRIVVKHKMKSSCIINEEIKISVQRFINSISYIISIVSAIEGNCSSQGT